MTTCVRQLAPTTDDWRANPLSNRRFPVRKTLQPIQRPVFIKSSAQGRPPPDPNTVHHNIFGRLFLVTSEDKSVASPRIAYFSIEGVLKYEAFCDDFGPMNLANVFLFCEMLEEQFTRCEGQLVAMRSKADKKSLTNAIFLIGCYMILKFKSHPDDVEKCMKPLNMHTLPYRDVSLTEQTFSLHLKDCWAGLWKAVQLQWVSAGSEGFDAAEYSHFGNPLNADMHEIVPGKFIAMQGPKDIPSGELWRDNYHQDGKYSHRDFSAAHYVDILHHFNVQAIMRLNTPEYNKEHFANGGIGLVDLYFEDCTCPPSDIVAKFMMIAEAIPGAIAVHCKSGLGRTGTLIALYMMTHHGFTAREAMGWIRIVRPGSIMGPQQQYLCDKEAVMARTGKCFRVQGSEFTLLGSGVDSVERLCAQAIRKVDSRLATLQRRRHLVVRDDEASTLLLRVAAQTKAISHSPARRNSIHSPTKHAPPGKTEVRYCADLLAMPTWD